MPVPANTHSVATGRAKEVVDAHQAEQDLVLWGAWFCPYNQRAWMALEERNIPYQYHEYNPYASKTELLKYNPLGLVPTLASMSRGSALYESDVLLEYIEDMYPPSEEHPSIFPADPWDKSWARLNLQHVSKKIFPAYMALMAADGPSQPAALETLYVALRLLASRVKGPYFAGEQYTIVDIGLAPLSRRFPRGIELYRGFRDEDVRPEWVKYQAAITARESLKKTTSALEYYEPVLLNFFKDVRPEDAIPLPADAS